VILDTNGLSALPDGSSEPPGRIAALARQHSLVIVSRDKYLDSIPGVDRIFW
jgi:predicted nucleic acid-binding protein